MLVSHAYSEAGIRRQVESMQKYVKVELVAPNSAFVLLWDNYRPPKDSRLTCYRTITFFGSQYLFLTPSMGLLTTKPRIVHIDYEPWSLIFWQVRLYVAVFSRSSKVICAGKKNTYRGYGGALGKLKRVVARSGIAACEHIVVASQMTGLVFERELGVPRKRMSVVTHIGTDIERFHPRNTKIVRTNQSALHVGYTGRLTEHKGIWDLVEAGRICVEKGLNVRVSFLGAGSLEAHMLAMCRKYKWLNVCTAVPSDEVADFLADLDVFAMPSRVLPDHEEHDGHSVIQAMACGLACVGTVSGILPELLGEDAGILVPPESPNSLADAIWRLANDGDLRRRLGVAARAKAEAELSYEKVSERKAEVYAKVLAMQGCRETWDGRLGSGL